MKVYDDHLDDRDIAAAEGKAEDHRRRMRQMKTAAIVAAMIVFMGFAGWIAWPAFNRRPAPPRFVAAPAPFEPPPPVFRKQHDIWPGRDDRWTAEVDPSPALLKLNADLAPFKFPLDPRLVEQADAASLARARSRYLVVAGVAAAPNAINPGRAHRVIDSATGLEKGEFPFEVNWWLKTVHPEGTVALYERGADAGLKVVDLAAGQTVATFERRAGEPMLQSCEFAGDKLLVTKPHSQGQFVRHLVWDWRKGELLLDLVQKRNSLIHNGRPALSPGGRYLAVIGLFRPEDDPHGPNQLVIFDLQTGALAGQKSIASPAVRNAVPAGWNVLAYSVDGRRLAGVRSDGLLNIWNAASGELVTSTLIEKHWENSKRGLVVFDEDQPVLVDSTFYSARLGAPVRLPNPPDTKHWQVCGYLSPGVVRVLSQQHKGPPSIEIVHADFSKDRNAAEKAVVVAKGDIPLAPLRADPLAVNAPKQAPAPQPIRANHKAIRWPKLTPTGEIATLLLAGPEAERGLLVRSSQAKRNVENGKLEPRHLEFVEFDITSGVARPLFELLNNEPTLHRLSLDFAADAQSILMVDFDDKRTLEIRNRTGVKTASFRPHLSQNIEQVIALADGTALVRTGGILVAGGGELSRWSCVPEKIEGVYRMPNVRMPIAIDGSRRVAAVAVGDEWRLIEVQTGAVVRKFEQPDAKIVGKQYVGWVGDAVAFSPDGKWLAWHFAHDAKQIVVVWNVETGAIQFVQRLSRTVGRQMAWLDDDSLGFSDLVFSVSRRRPIRWFPPRAFGKMPIRLLAGGLACTGEKGSELRTPVWPDDLVADVLAELDKTQPNIIVEPGMAVEVRCEFKDVRESKFHTPQSFATTLRSNLQQQGFSVAKQDAGMNGPAKDAAGKDPIVLVCVVSPALNPGAKELPLRADVAWTVGERTLYSERVFDRRSPFAPKESEPLNAIAAILHEYRPRAIVLGTATGGDAIPSAPLKMSAP